MVVIPLLLREEKRERVCVCVWMREGARCRDAIRVGPAWLQWYSSKFVMDVKLEAKAVDTRLAKVQSGSGSAPSGLNPDPNPRSGPDRT
jgi:hypothetical protein